MPLLLEGHFSSKSPLKYLRDHKLQITNYDSSTNSGLDIYTLHSEELESASHPERGWKVKVWDEGV